MHLPSGLEAIELPGLPRGGTPAAPRAPPGLDPAAGVWPAPPAISTQGALEAQVAALTAQLDAANSMLRRMSQLAPRLDFATANDRMRNKLSDTVV